jgi:ABC-type antimicrobial peptide transport system permease subunit
VATVNPQLALTFQPLSAQLRASLTRERLMALLAGFFGGLALLLAGVGLYGITAYSISRQRTEIGIRLALGAAPSGVVGLLLARVFLQLGIGIAAGIGFSFWASRFVSGLIYGVQLRDLTSLAGGAMMLAAIGMLAGWLPARRAAQMDPLVVLRES